MERVFLYLLVEMSFLCKGSRQKINSSHETEISKKQSFYDFQVFR